MLRSSNVFVRNFRNKLVSRYGDMWWVFHKIPEDFSEQERIQGRQLVKTALYHIRRALKESASIFEVSHDDTLVVAIFAGPEHVREILNLRGFPAFWDGSDRGPRCSMIKALERNAGPEHAGLIAEFQEMLESVYYVEDFDSYEDDRAANPQQMRSFDRSDFRPVLARVEQLSQSAYS